MLMHGLHNKNEPQKTLHLIHKSNQYSFHMKRSKKGAKIYNVERLKFIFITRGTQNLIWEISILSLSEATRALYQYSNISIIPVIHSFSK